MSQQDKTYAERVRELEEEGLTTSDAQAVVDAEDLGRYDSIEGVYPPRPEDDER